MDIDQEVVREPFEDNHHCIEQTDADNNNACHSRHSIDETDHTDRLYQDDGRSSGDSYPSSPRSFVEEVKFAESFGINLANKTKASCCSRSSNNGNSRIKCNPIYENLMRSDHFGSETTSTSKVPPSPTPMIKTSVTSDCIYHKGTFYQKGDIVALCDQDDGQLYFAQLTGFLQDQYCEKSASVNWLVPHKPTSRELFDPSAYKIGLEDVTLRKLDCMTFVRHCPHDYYIRKIFQSGEESIQQDKQSQGVDLREKSKERSYIWTTMKPCRVPQIKAHSESIAPLVAVAGPHQHLQDLTKIREVIQLDKNETSPSATN